jgi:hypothetical protein
MLRKICALLLSVAQVLGCLWRRLATAAKVFLTGYEFPHGIYDVVFL